MEASSGIEYFERRRTESLERANATSEPSIAKFYREMADRYALASVEAKRSMAVPAG